MADFAESRKEKKWTPFRFSWKEFLIYGTIWFILSGIGGGVWKMGSFLIKETARIRQLIEWKEFFDRDSSWKDRGENRFKYRSRNKSRNFVHLESWIRENLPESETVQFKAAGRAFFETAAMLRGGSLIGIPDTFAELTSRLQVELDEETWKPFLADLGGEIIDQLPEEPEPNSIAEILEICGNQFSLKREKEVLLGTGWTAGTGEKNESNREPPKRTDSPPDPAEKPKECRGGICRR